jgi:hypothetical protein
MARHKGPRKNKNRNTLDFLDTLLRLQEHTTVFFAHKEGVRGRGMSRTLPQEEVPHSTARLQPNKCSVRIFTRNRAGECWRLNPGLVHAK